MGVLTDETTRLCGEIRALRGARARFLSRLGIEVAKSRQEVRAEMAAARRAWRGALPAEPRAIEVQAPEGVAPEAEAVVVPEAEPELMEERPMEEEPSVEAVAETEPEREEAEEAHEMPKEPTETRLRKKGKKRR